MHLTCHRRFLGMSGYGTICAITYWVNQFVSPTYLSDILHWVRLFALLIMHKLVYGVHWSTLNCIRYPHLPLVHKGGSMEPPKKTTFPPEFFDYFDTIYGIYTNHNHIPAKSLKCLYCFKMTAKYRFSFRVISMILAKTWKTTFPKEFFDEIWLKLGDHEYISICWNKVLRR